MSQKKAVKDFGGDVFTQEYRELLARQEEVRQQDAARNYLELGIAYGHAVGIAVKREHALKVAVDALKSIDLLPPEGG
jgi:hypothetical protein